MVNNKYVSAINRVIVKEHLSMNREEVVYLIVQIRKLIESNNTANSYKTAWFFCNWALHPLKEHGHDDLKELFDKLYLECKNEINGIIDNTKTNNIFSFLEFKLLKNDIVRLFKESCINTNIITDNKIWKSFILNLAYELEGQPIQCKNNDDISEKGKSLGISEHIRKIELYTIDHTSFAVKIVFNKPIKNKRREYKEYTAGLGFI